MAQNANNQDDTSSATDEGTRTTEEDLRKLKYGDEEVDTSQDDEDEASEGSEDDEDSEEVGDDDGKTDDDTEDDDSDEASDEDSDDDDSEFVKEFPNIKGDTLVDYARNLEATISESNKEGKRLADENAALKQRVAELEKSPPVGDNQDGNQQNGLDLSNPVNAFVKQQMDAQIAEAFSEFSQTYDQVQNPVEYDKFVKEVNILSQVIMQSEQRLASPKELYSKAAAVLGWSPKNEVDSKDRLKIAVKDRTSMSKTGGTGSIKKTPKSKVTQAMIVANRKMYPNKTDDEIRKELEPYVQ